MSSVIDDALIRRIDAAIYATSVSREAIEFDWPECHKPKCQGTHGRPESAMASIQIKIAQSVRDELAYELVTRPDVHDDDTGDNPALLAVYTLATLLRTHNVHETGTYVRSAQLIVDAYPELIAALTI